MEGDASLRAGVPVLGLDLSRHRRRGAVHPPALMCAVRFPLPAWSCWPCARPRGEDSLFAEANRAGRGRGLLLLMGGNLTLSYAELAVSSGLAALIIAITPLWFLVLDSLLLGDHHVAGRGKAGAGARNGRTARPGLAAVASRQPWAPRMLGIHQLDRRIILAGRSDQSCRSAGSPGWMFSAPPAGKSPPQA